MVWDLHASNRGTGLPLEGVRVLDLSRVLAGPFAAMVVGDLGADVIKVESPTGDPVRHLAPPRFGDDSTYYLAVNRHRRNVVADLRRDDDFAMVEDLVRQADAVVENYLPSQYAALGIARLRAANPDCVWISVTPANTPSPLAEEPSFDLLAQARSGLMGVTGNVGGEPTKVGAPIADVVTGLYAAVGLVTGLYARLAKQPGRHFEVPLLESTMTALVNQAQGYLATGVLPRRLGNNHPSICPYGPVHASDGLLMLAVGTDLQFRRLVEVLGSAELGSPQFAGNDDRLAHRHELQVLLDGIFSQRTVKEWSERLAGVGVPFSPIYELDGAFSQDSIALGDFVGLVETPAGAMPTMRSPLRIDGVRPSVRRGPRRLGEDNAEF